MKRLNFVVQNEVYKTLKALKERTQAHSLAEVFRNALRLYSWAVSEFEKGRAIISRTENHEPEQVSLPSHLSWWPASAAESQSEKIVASTRGGGKTGSLAKVLPDPTKVGFGIGKELEEWLQKMEQSLRQLADELGKINQEKRTGFGGGILRGRLVYNLDELSDILNEVRDLPRRLDS